MRELSYLYGLFPFFVGFLWYTFYILRSSLLSTAIRGHFPRLLPVLRDGNRFGSDDPRIRPPRLAFPTTLGDFSGLLTSQLQKLETVKHAQLVADNGGGDNSRNWL